MGLVFVSLFDLRIGLRFGVRSEFSLSTVWHTVERLNSDLTPNQMEAGQEGENSSL